MTGKQVDRPALLARLSRHEQLPLTLVSAPAGSGKSHLVVQWLQTLTGNFGWVSLDDGDRELLRFVRYIRAAVECVCPEVGHATRALLDSPAPPQPAQLAEALLYDLDELPGRIVLVLDDYHNADSSDIRTFMARLLQSMPSTLHLILITRTDPSLPLSRLRSQLQLGEIRNAELRFSLPEALVLFEALVGKTVERDIIELAHRRTEGWITGLQLTAILLRATDDHQAVARHLAANVHQWIVEYLVSEVLEKLTERQRTLLLKSSLFAKFSAPMLEHVLAPLLGQGEGTVLLQELVKKNLFLISLDNAGVWYRFHHLFGELLSQRLQRETTPARLQELQLRASAWFEHQGLIEDAIEQALAAGAPPEAAMLVERHLPEALNSEEWRDIEQWISLLPESVLERPGILVSRAFVQHFRYRLPAVRCLIGQVETQLTSGTAGTSAAGSDHSFDYSSDQSNGWRDVWLGAVHCLAAQDAHYQGESSRCLQVAQDALRRLPLPWAFARGIAEFYYIYGLHQAEMTEMALDYCAEELSQQTGRVNLRTTRLYQGLGAVRYASAACTELHEVASTYIDVAHRLERTISAGWAHYLRGWSSYQLNDLAHAESNFRLLQQMRHKVHLRATVDGYTGLALTLHARNHVVEARAVAEELRNFLVQFGPLALVPTATSLMNRLLLMDGECVKVPRIENLDDQLGGDLWEMPALTAVRAMLYDGCADRFPEAADLLSRIRSYAQKTNNIRRTIEVDVLTTLLYGVRGETERAIAQLSSAIRLGAPGDVLRMFLDEGPALRPYLEMLLVRNVERRYVQQILDAFVATTAATPATVGASAGAAITEATLTNREIEVLHLLAERLTNDEIADQLVISTLTVKKHARNIYQKLNVENRRQAVMRARRMGILQPVPAIEERL